MGLFALHPQLQADCLVVGDLPVCRVLLMNNRLFPWIILVPMRSGARELFDLDPTDYRLVMEEVRMCAQQFGAMTGAHKMNVAALGNQVAQLHIHIVARFEKDAAWPNPVWNSGIAPSAYTSQEKTKLVADLQKKLGVG